MLKRLLVSYYKMSINQFVSGLRHYRILSDFFIFTFLFLLGKRERPEGKDSPDFRGGLVGRGSLCLAPGRRWLAWLHAGESIEPASSSH